MDLCDLCALHAQLFRHSHGHSLGFVGNICSACGNIIDRGLQPPVPRGLDQIDASLDRQFIPFTPGTSQFRDPVTYFLPPEIVSEIFQMCVEYVGPVIHGPPVDPPEYSPLPLSAVCRAWRRIAFSTPRIWTYLPIDLDSRLFTALPPAGMKPAGYQIAEDWLARTGCLPLHIKLSKRGAFRPEEQMWIIEPLFQVIYLVNAYSGRWQHLEITLPNILLRRLAQNLPVGCRPVLRTLQLQMTDATEGVSTQERCMIRMGSLSPLEVRIDAISYESINITWTRLTVLVAAQFYIDEAIRVIVDAPQLQVCVIFDAQDRDHPMFSSGDVWTHGSIKDVVFRSARDDVGVGEFLKLLRLPSLESLDIETVESDVEGEHFLSHITQFLRRSSPPLTDLVLSIPEISLPVILELLRQIPSITKLLLSRPFESEIWTELVNSIGRPSPSTGAIFLPKLRRLVIEMPADAGPSVRGWDKIVETMVALVSDCETHFCRDAQMISVLYSIERSYDMNMSDITIPMRTSNILGLADVVMAGVPFQVGLEPDSNVRIRCLDVIRLRDSLSTYDPNGVHQVDWYTRLGQVSLHKYNGDTDDSDVDTDGVDVDMD